MEQKNSSDSVQQKLNNLEEKYELSHKYFKFTLSIISTIIIVVGIIITILSLSQSNRTDSAIERVDNAIVEMKNEFDILAQRTLRKPILSVRYNEQPLNGQFIEIIQKGYPGEIYRFPRIYFENIGDKATDFVTIRIHTDPEGIEFPTGESAFTEYDSYFDSYSKMVFTTFNWRISPKEKFRLNAEFKKYGKNQNFNCRLEVFYGETEPIISDFKILIKSQDEE